jgi:hypothetical protein
MKVATVIAAVGWLCLSPVFANAQTTASGNVKKNPAASKPTPRTPDGHPDLNGQWHHRIGEPAPLIKPGESYNAKAAHAPGINQYQEPAAVYKPEFQAKVKDLDAHSLDKDPSWSCGPPGVPRIGPPQKIVQTAKEIVFLYDDLTGNFFRVVRMNVPHRKEIEPSAHGDSVGRWEGDTLVVDVTNLDDSTWLQDRGAFHTDKLHVTERLRREGDTLFYEVTAEDPAVLAQPLVEKRVLPLMTTYDIEEAPRCVERDRGNIPETSNTERSTR